MAIEKVKCEEVKFKDLVQLKLLGKLGEAVELMRRGESLSGLLLYAAGAIKKTDIAASIVDRAIHTQNDTAWLSLREICQNCLDSYAEKGRELEGRRVVDIHYDERSGELSFTDHGCGMSLDKVMNELLIPFMGTKSHGGIQRGEHGIGWYSCLDLCDKVDVETKTSGEGLTMMHARKRADGEWVSYFDSANPMRAAARLGGTKVTMHLRDRERGRDVLAKLRKYVGNVGEEGADVFFSCGENTEKVNTEAREFRLAVEGSVTNTRGEGKLRIYIKETKNRQSSWLLTHGELYTDEKEVAPFSDKVPHERLWNAFRWAGIRIWVDMPTNLQSTKGRRGLVPKDGARCRSALYAAFEEAILVLLTDEKLVNKVDSSVLEFMGAITAHDYSKEIGDDIREAVVHGADAFKKHSEGRLRGLGENTAGQGWTGTGSGGGMADIIAGLKSGTMGGGARAGEDAGGRTRAEQPDDGPLDDMDIRIHDDKEFVSRLNKTPFVPAVAVKDSAQTETRVSLMDMEAAAKSHTLFFFPQDEPGSKGDGTYVDSGNRVGKEIASKLITKFAPPMKKVQESDVQVRPAPERRPESKPDETKPINVLEHVELAVMQKITEASGKAFEYRAFLTLCRRIDDVICRASKLKPSQVMVHFYPDEWDSTAHMAHTDKSSISFNLADGTAGKFVDAMRQGGIGEETLRSLIMVMIHEKAHRLVEERYAIHGEKFNEMWILLQKEFDGYCVGKKIDLLAEANALLAAYGPMQETKVEELMAFTGNPRRYVRK